MARTPEECIKGLIAMKLSSTSGERETCQHPNCTATFFKGKLMGGMGVFSTARNEEERLQKSIAVHKKYLTGDPARDDQLNRNIARSQEELEKVHSTLAELGIK